MRVIYSVCFAIAAITIAYADQLQNPQSYFGLVLRRDEFDGVVSEYDYRGLFLEQLESLGSTFGEGQDTQSSNSVPEAIDTPKYSDDITCSSAPAVLGDILEGLLVLVSDSTVSNNPYFIKLVIGMALDPLTSFIKTNNLISLDNLIALNNGISAVESALTTLQALPGIDDYINPTLSALSKAKAVVKLLMKCGESNANNQLPKPAFQEVHCNTIADIYRTTVAESPKNAPVIPESASDDLKRLTTGSLNVLDIMSKHSISDSNEELFDHVPVFSGDLLDQYRQELIFQSESDKLKAFAQINLGMAVSLSNALEACMYVASDSVAAAEEYTAEEIARGDESDMDEEDEEEIGEDMASDE